MIKKREAIIQKVKSKYWQHTHKYGIQIPKSVKEALEIDKENGDHIWRDSIAEEMNKIKTEQAFELYENNRWISTDHALLGVRHQTWREFL